MRTTLNGLPPETLREIFFFAVLLNARSDQLTPVRISRVCRNWRDACLSDGRLWSYLQLDHNTSSPRFSERAKDIFDTWIARSGQAPLNYKVSFDFKRYRPGEDGIKCAIHIVTTLIKEHKRWRDVDFYWAWEFEFPIDIGPFIATSLPMLTSLRVAYKRQSHITIDLGQSSHLRSVDLNGNFSISAGEGTLHHLKERSTLAFRDNYKAEDVIRSCQNFLGVAPFLEELYLIFEHGLSLPSSPLDNNRPVYHGLRRLRLFPSNGSDDFIDNVTLPSLVALEIPCGVSPFEMVERRPCLKLLHFFERSLPPLTSLDIGASGCRDFEDSFIPCLKLLPTLEQLQVIVAPVSVRFFNELTVPESGDGSIVCPKLEALCFRDLKCLDSAVCAEALISMLESRARITATFRDIRFAGPGFTVDSTIRPSRLREYDQETKALLLKNLMVGKIRHHFG